jgi:hypothetical protein
MKLLLPGDVETHAATIAISQLDSCKPESLAAPALGNHKGRTVDLEVARHVSDAP